MKVKPPLGAVPDGVTDCVANTTTPLWLTVNIVLFAIPFTKNKSFALPDTVVVPVLDTDSKSILPDLIRKISPVTFTLADTLPETIALPIYGKDDIA